MGLNGTINTSPSLRTFKSDPLERLVTSNWYMNDSSQTTATMSITLQSIKMVLRTSNVYYVERSRD